MIGIILFVVTLYMFMQHLSQYDTGDANVSDNDTSDDTYLECCHSEVTNHQRTAPV